MGIKTQKPLNLNTKFGIIDNVSDIIHVKIQGDHPVGTPWHTGEVLLLCEFSHLFFMTTAFAHVS